MVEEGEPATAHMEGYSCSIKINKNHDLFKILGQQSSLRTVILFAVAHELGHCYSALYLKIKLDPQWQFKLKDSLYLATLLQQEEIFADSYSFLILRHSYDYDTLKRIVMQLRLHESEYSSHGGDRTFLTNEKFKKLIVFASDQEILNNIQ